MITAAIIQARMNSSRLPGKVLHMIEGSTMLDWVVERVKRAKCINKVIVATTSDSTDDPIAAHCAEKQYEVYRGSQFDVLDRFYQAARLLNADTIIRITADCPFIDPALVDDLYHQYWESGVDFAANRLPPPWGRTYPIGLDTEICTFAHLERAWRETTAAYHREHVMPFFYDTPGRFRVLVAHASKDYGHLRWTVDTPDDLRLVRAIAVRFAPRNDFSWMEIVDLVESEPGLLQINQAVSAKDMREIDDRTGNP